MAKKNLSQTDLKIIQKNLTKQSRQKYRIDEWIKPLQTIKIFKTSCTGYHYFCTDLFEERLRNPAKCTFSPHTEFAI